MPLGVKSRVVVSVRQQPWGSVAVGAVEEAAVQQLEQV